MNNHIQVSVTVKDGFNPNDVITFVRATGGLLLGAQGQTMDFSINKRMMSHLRSHDAVQTVVEAGEVHRPIPIPEVSQIATEEEKPEEKVDETETETETETEIEENSDSPSEEESDESENDSKGEKFGFWKKH